MPGRAAGAEVEYVEVESACNCSSRWQRYASRWYVERAYRHGKEWDLRKTCWRGLVDTGVQAISTTFARIDHRLPIPESRGQ